MSDIQEFKKSKNKKIIIALIIAVLAAALACVCSYMLLAPQRTTVFVFNADYGAGTQVTKQMLTGIQVDSSVVAGGQRISTGEYFVTGGNFDSIMQSAGLLRSDVRSGAMLMSSMLTTTGGNQIEMNMKKNAIAITIAVSPITGVTSQLSGGSRVNVYASYGADTVLLHQNIRVLKTEKTSGGISSVTLEVDHTQSLELVHASTFGVIHLGLVDANGYLHTTQEMPSYNLAGFSVPAITDNPTGVTVQLPETTEGQESSGVSDGNLPIPTSDNK